MIEYFWYERNDMQRLTLYLVLVISGNFAISFHNNIQDLLVHSGISYIQNAGSLPWVILMYRTFEFSRVPMAQGKQVKWPKKIRQGEHRELEILSKRR